MNAYSQRQGKTLATLRFLYDGERINENDTPEGLDMEDEDTIDVMIEQVHLMSPTCANSKIGGFRVQL